MVTDPGANPAAHDRDSNLQSVDCKSDALSIKLSGHLSSKHALKVK